MKILIIGGGGREHALSWRLSQSPAVTQLIASPGNPGIAAIGRCEPAPQALAGYADLAEKEGVSFTIVGPEATLVEGIVDLFQSRGLKIVGPTRAAARLEGSKIFAKEFFERAGIPTARSVQVHTVREASAALRQFGSPVVIKADGLAAGKGVIIADGESEGRKAVEQLGPHLVIEEFLQGEEVSFIGLSNGQDIWPFAPAQDHKRAFDGDQGPNTGGMGAFSYAGILSAAERDQILDSVMLPTLNRMRAEGTPFTGFLYAGLMMTVDGPKVLEFNVRLGDPETQALLFGYRGDLAQVLAAVAAGANPEADLTDSIPAACIVLAASGYPQTPRSGDSISGIEDAEREGAKVFHAGTRMCDGQLVTSGGRVLGVTAASDTLHSALRQAYAAVGRISFEGMHYRSDIGRKALAKAQ